MQTTRGSTFAAGLRTTILLALLTAALVTIGWAIGGASIALVFLFIAAAMNFFAYWFSDRMALKMARAEPLEPSDDPELFRMTEDLCRAAELPMPRLYMIPQPQPNAFATGRNPKNSAVAVTEGIRRSMPDNELRGVIAHELAHIGNRDILIQSVAATIGGAITLLSRMLLFGFGRNRNAGPLGLVIILVTVILAPIAAAIVQMAVSRQREFAADATGASICGDPEALASALLRLEQGAEAIPMEVNEASEPLYIVKPLRGGGVRNLFSTHPPIPERVRRLRQMRPTIA